MLNVRDNVTERYNLEFEPESNKMGTYTSATGLVEKMRSSRLERKTSQGRKQKTKQKQLPTTDRLDDWLYRPFPRPKNGLIRY